MSRMSRRGRPVPPGQLPLPGWDWPEATPPPPTSPLWEWIDRAVGMIRGLVLALGEVTADDLRGAALLPPEEPWWWGRAWSTARRAGIIRRTGEYIASRTAGRNGSLITVWTRGPAL